jgi:hypothetical protein
MMPTTARDDERSAGHGEAASSVVGFGETDRAGPRSVWRSGRLRLREMTFPRIVQRRLYHRMGTDWEYGLERPRTRIKLTLRGHTIT